MSPPVVKLVVAVLATSDQLGHGTMLEKKNYTVLKMKEVVERVVLVQVNRQLLQCNILAVNLQEMTVALLLRQFYCKYFTVIY